MKNKDNKLKAIIENEIKSALQQIANKYKIAFTVSISTDNFNNCYLLEQARESKHFCNIRDTD